MGYIIVTLLVLVIGLGLLIPALRPTRARNAYINPALTSRVEEIPTNATPRLPSQRWRPPAWTVHEPAREKGL